MFISKLVFVVITIAISLVSFANAQEQFKVRVDMMLTTCDIINSHVDNCTTDFVRPGTVSIPLSANGVGEWNFNKESDVLHAYMEIIHVDDQAKLPYNIFIYVSSGRQKIKNGSVSVNVALADKLNNIQISTPLESTDDNKYYDMCLFINDSYSLEKDDNSEKQGLAANRIEEIKKQFQSIK